MTQEIIFRKFIAVGLKSGAEAGQFGQGFNYWIEAGFELNSDLQRKKCEKALDDVLLLIDHKALGVDVDLGLEATSANLCRFIKAELTRRSSEKVSRVRMIRGDGAACSL